MEDSQFTASYFDISYYPHNSTAVFYIYGSSALSGKIKAEFELVVYGLSIYQDSIDLCSLGYSSICPISSGHIDVDGTYTVTSDLTSKIPGVAYSIPDLDAYVKVVVYSTDDSNNETPLACLKAIVSNGKTVQTRYAGWPIAAISGFGLIVSSFVSILGHSATASHIASNSVSLFIYFQNLAIMAMMGVARVPPIAASWAQNFMWSLGIIDVKFMQDIIYWYVQSTGGDVTAVLDNKDVISISVQKTKKILKREISAAAASDDYLSDSSLYYTDEYNLSSKTLVLRGIQRVAYLANIEISNIFMTSIIFFLFVGFALICLISIFRGFCEILVRSGSVQKHRFSYFRANWNLIIKGSIYRYIDITFSTIVLLCLWEFTQNNSKGCLAFAIIIFVVIGIMMLVAAIKILLQGIKSVGQYKNPAYLLFGEESFYFKYGFLYSQYLAKRYYWVVIHLFYLFVRALLIAVLQSQGKVCACIIFAIEIIHTVVVIYFRPYMDKRTNIFNIFIAVINLINSIFFLFYSNVFRQPEVVSSVAAVVYFIMNAIFALILLLFTIITCTISLIHKNPDVQYEQVKDDRAAFMPTENVASPNEELELTALGATAMQGQDRNSYLFGTTDSSEKPRLSPYELDDLNSKAHLEPYNPDISEQNLTSDRLNPFANNNDDSASVASDSYTDARNPFSNNSRYHL
ncbi:hypothetical protein C6P42_000492 [Pichia californica]|nr:hypothetical protein C6P42_000492 [[Candida] californica]